MAKRRKRKDGKPPRVRLTIDLAGEDYAEIAAVAHRTGLTEAQAMSRLMAIGMAIVEDKSADAITLVGELRMQEAIRNVALKVKPPKRNPTVAALRKALYDTSLPPQIEGGGA